jgi:hypothetical protein
MSFRTISIIYNDPERPLLRYIHQKSTVELDISNAIIGLTNDPNEQVNHDIVGVLFPRDSEDFAEWHYELLDHLYYPWTGVPVVQGGTTSASHFFIPYGNEDIDLYGVNNPVYGPYGAYLWTHLEISTTKFVQGLLFTRATNAGDNKKRMYLNKDSWAGTVAATVGTTEVDLLGMAYIPCTDRLNNTEV